VRRRPALATAAALLLLFGLAGGLLYALVPTMPPAPRPQPEDPDVLAIRSIHARLKDGETVEFVQDGSLLRSRWLDDGEEGDCTTAPDPDGGGVIVDSPRQIARLELLPEVPLARYEFSVRVKQDHERVGPPGVYALHHARPVDLVHPDPDVLAHSFVSLWFSEVIPYPRMLFALMEYEGVITANSQFRLTKLPEGSGPWHTLTVRVTPEKVRFLHDGAEVAKATPDDLVERGQKLRLGTIAGHGGPIDPAVNFKGGVGLYLQLHARATFSSITLKPLP
jgi:hypothetical protein